MAEQRNKEHQHFRDHIPEDVRQHAENAREEMRKSWATLLPHPLNLSLTGAQRARKCCLRLAS